MTNQQVFEAFAAGKEGSANSVHSAYQQTDDGKYTVLYSYSTPIAVRHPKGDCYFDARKYSVTTSKQQNQAMRECSNHLAVLPHNRFRDYLKHLNVYLGGAR